MKTKIFAFLLILSLLLASCASVPESPQNEESKQALSASNHYAQVINHLAKSKHLFFGKLFESESLNIKIENEDEILKGRYNADYAENRYAFDFALDYKTIIEELKSIEGSVVFAEGYTYSSFEGISTLPFKKQADTKGIEAEALRALCGIGGLASSAFEKEPEKYYRFVETDDKKATVAAFSINGEDIKACSEASDFAQKYGFDRESIELNCSGSLKTEPDKSRGLTVTDFQIESTLSFTAGEKFCEFTLKHDDSSFDALLAVYNDADKKEPCSQYSLNAENGKGKLTLNGTPREIDNADLQKAPEGFKCHTIAFPFEYKETENEELCGYSLEFTQINFKGDAPAAQSNTNTEDLGYSFAEFIEPLTLNFNRTSEPSSCRISGVQGSTVFEINFESSGGEIVIPQEYTENEYEYYLELNEKAEDFCQRFDILSQAESVEKITVKNGDSLYFIDPWQKCGYFETEFTMAENEIHFSDGRILPFIYEELTYNEQEGHHTAVINGRNYLLTTFTSNEGSLCQLLECTDEFEGYAVTSSVLYYPELEYGKISMGFTFEIEDEKYTLTYLDGYTEQHTIVLDEESGSYIFADE